MIKTELKESRTIEGGNASNFGGMNLCSLHPDMKKTQACRDSDCKWSGVTLSLFTAFIALSITDYKCTPCRLLLRALLHHVGLSSLKLRPTRDGWRSSQVPEHLLTILLNAVAFLLHVSVIALTFDGLLLS